ncbi:MAG TPA: ROK family protein [Verrucomicrobiales bacterium]|nr:ROK family protein [Verrucomicrobiales bacterium]
MMIAGIDIGGTQIKAAAFSEDGHLISSVLTPGEALCGPAWRESVRDALTALEKECGQRVEKVGLAAPGLAAKDGRSIRHMPGRLDGLVGLDWTTFLQRETPVPVLNDAHAALLGEVWCGAARGARDCFMLTLGTGVGGAAMCDGRLLTGHLGRAGHLGHISLDPNGSPDIVNTPGSLEEAIGNHSAGLRTGGRFTMTRDLLAAAASGDAAAQTVWETSVRALAAGIASLINVLDPAVVILGGGILTAGDQLMIPLRAHMDKMEWRPDGIGVPLVIAQLGEVAGACGAAWQARQTG